MVSSSVPAPCTRRSPFGAILPEPKPAYISANASATPCGRPACVIAGTQPGSGMSTTCSVLPSAAPSFSAIWRVEYEGPWRSTTSPFSDGLRSSFAASSPMSFVAIMGIG